MTQAGGICAYCGKPVLTGEEKPEHAIPAALGSSLSVRTVCEPCNAWAGKEIDQPFLEDDWVLIHRSQAGVVDPRRGRKGREISSPILRGYTKDGDFLKLDGKGEPQISSRIVEFEDGRFQIRAGSVEEMERLKRRIERRTGKEITEENIKTTSTQPRIEFRIVVDTLVWLRETAKIALAVSSEVYSEEWRLGPDARRLREWLQGVDLLAPAETLIGLEPQNVAGTPVEGLVDGVEHLVFFHQVSGTTFLSAVLLGSVFTSIPVNSREKDAPGRAWKINPSKPRVDGETTLATVFAEATQRHLQLRLDEEPDRRLDEKAIEHPYPDDDLMNNRTASIERWVDEDAAAEGE